MKRSEMIKILCKSFKEHAIFGKYASIEDAEAVLKDIEKAGMLPPQAHRTDAGHFPGDNYEYWINEWDEE